MYKITGRRYHIVNRPTGGGKRGPSQYHPGFVYQGCTDVRHCARHSRSS